MYYILEWEMDKMRKMAKHLSVWPHSMCIQNLKTGSHWSYENLLGEKENWTNKGNDKQQHADYLLHNTTSIPNICTKFQNPRRSKFLRNPWHKFPYVLHWSKRWKRKNGKRRQKLIIETWFSFPQYTWPFSRGIQSLKTLAVIGAENSVMKVLLERKKNGKIKGMISSSMLILFYTIQQVITNICTKFQNPRHSSSWEIFDTNFPMYYITLIEAEKSVTENLIGERKMDK